MSIPTSEPLFSEEDDKLPPARERRQQRSVVPQGRGEQAGFLSQLARQVTPGYEFFLYSLLSGILIGIAILVDARGLYLLAILFVPFLGPVYGLSLAASAGLGKLFLKSLGALLIASLIIFGSGVLTGVVAGNFLPQSVYEQIGPYTLLSWPDFLVVAAGAGLGAYMLARSPRQKPLVANVALAYELFLPLAVSGFGLTASQYANWLDALMVFLVHLVLAGVTGMLVLMIVGLRPKNVFGYAPAAILLTLALIGVFTISGFGRSSPILAGVAETATATLTSTPTPTQMPTPTPSRQPAQATMTLTITLQPSSTPTMTVTPEPTPIWALIAAPTGGGAIIREEPEGRAISSLLNGNLVEVISEPLRGESGTIWVQIRTDTGLVGWIVQALLATATPSPGW